MDVFHAARFITVGFNKLVWKATILSVHLPCVNVTLDSGALCSESTQSATEPNNEGGIPLTLYYVLVFSWTTFFKQV